MRRSRAQNNCLRWKSHLMKWILQDATSIKSFMGVCIPQWPQSNYHFLLFFLFLLFFPFCPHPLLLPLRLCRNILCKSSKKKKRKSKNGCSSCSRFVCVYPRATSLEELWHVRPFIHFPPSNKEKFTEKHLIITTSVCLQTWDVMMGVCFIFLDCC